LCGVPGSGKTWIATKLRDKFMYIPHDEYPVGSYYEAIGIAATMSSRPILAEAPFRISILIQQPHKLGLTVITHYLRLSPNVIISRYEARDRKPFPKQHLTNLVKYNKRDWDSSGSPEEILEYLRNKA
jgi:hypothetical protein